MKDRQPPKSKQPEARRRGDGKTGTRLGPEAQGRIGNKLRAMYDDIVNQGVPDRFADLLKELDSKEEKTKD